jgi:hypothetical protein
VRTLILRTDLDAFLQALPEKAIATRHRPASEPSALTIWPFRSSGFADGCCTVETVTFFAGSGGQHAPTSTNGIHRDMAGDYRIS